MTVSIYYKLYFDKYNHIIVVTITDSDESEYIQKRFLTDKHFNSKTEALEWYNLNMKERDNKIESNVKDLKLENNNLYSELKLLDKRVKRLEDKWQNHI